MADNSKCEKKKKSRQSITLDTKRKIIKLSDDSVSNSEIGRRLSLPRTTVVTVLKNKEKILNEVRSATPANTTIIRKRDNIISDMEKLLMVWIDDQTSQHILLSQAIIQNKALSLFADMKAMRGEAAKDAEFAASRGWFYRFKHRINLHLDTEAAANFPDQLASIIFNGNYSQMQIFNVDETGLYWKKMPSKTIIAKEEKSVPGFKISKDRLTLLLGSNAAGDLKLKPMLIYHTENPKDLKNYAKSSLPIYWKSNSSAWVTATLFEEWFSNYFVPTVKEYCAEKAIPFQILLLLDNASCHPKSLDGLYPNVKVIFLPANTTSFLQPMDQGVIATFKSYYLRKTFTKAIAATESESKSVRRRAKAVKEFWKNYTLFDGIKTIRDAWDEVEQSTLRGVWRNLCPQLTTDDFEGFENYVEKATANIVDMAKMLGLEVASEDVAELLGSHSLPLSNQDLLELEELNKTEEESHSENVVTPVPKELNCKELSKAFTLLEGAMAIFEKADPNFERSAKVNAGILDQYACYRKMYRENKRRAIIESSLSTYFHKGQSFKILNQPSTSTRSRKRILDVMQNKEDPDCEEFVSYPTDLLQQIYTVNLPSQASVNPEPNLP